MSRVAFTRRAGSKVRHAASGRRTAGPRSSCAAQCGAAIGRWLEEDFHPDHPDACSKCAEIVRGWAPRA